MYFTKEINLEVSVYGKYIAAKNGTYYQPHDPAEFDIKSVTFNGIDITETLRQAGFDFAQLELEILDTINYEI